MSALGMPGNRSATRDIEPGMSTINSHRPRAAALALMIAAAALSGCSTTSGVSAGSTTPTSNDTGTCPSAKIAMRSGSVPSPYSYTWTVTVDGDRGSMQAQGGDRGAEKWDRTFVADDAVLTALCGYATDVAGRSPTDSVGGSTMQAEYTPQGGSPVVGPSGVEGSSAPEWMAKNLPSGDWAALVQQLEDWSNTPRTTATPTS